MIGQLEVLAEIARLGSVGRAAHALHLTQPAATWRLQALERELGAVLFERTGRGMRLTDAGRTALPYAERAIRALEDLESWISARGLSAIAIGPRATVAPPAPDTRTPRTRRDGTAR